MVAKVRPATLADLPAMMAMGADVHAESPRYSMLPLNVEKAERIATAVIGLGGAHVAEIDGQTVGMVAGFVMEHWLSDISIASDYTLYVKPEHRGSRIAAMLVMAFEEWAISKGVTDIVPGTSSMINTEATVSFYQKLGYTHSGYVFFKRVKE